MCVYVCVRADTWCMLFTETKSSHSAGRSPHGLSSGIPLFSGMLLTFNIMFISEQCLCLLSLLNWVFTSWRWDMTKVLYHITICLRGPDITGTVLPGQMKCCFSVPLFWNIHKGQLVMQSPARVGRAGWNAMWELWFVVPTIAHGPSNHWLVPQVGLFCHTLFEGRRFNNLWVLRGIHGKARLNFSHTVYLVPAAGGLLEGVFRTLSIRFASIGCDIKLNRLLTGRWDGNEAARMHAHWLPDLTCCGSVLHKSRPNRSWSLATAPLCFLYLFLICIDVNPMAPSIDMQEQ